MHPAPISEVSDQVHGRTRQLATKMVAPSRPGGLGARTFSIHKGTSWRGWYEFPENPHIRFLADSGPRRGADATL